MHTCMYVHCTKTGQELSWKLFTVYTWLICDIWMLEIHSSRSWKLFLRQQCHASTETKFFYNQIKSCFLSATDYTVKNGFPKRKTPTLTGGFSFFFLVGFTCKHCSVESARCQLMTLMIALEWIPSLTLRKKQNTTTHVNTIVKDYRWHYELYSVWSSVFQKMSSES